MIKPMMFNSQRISHQISLLEPVKTGCRSEMLYKREKLCYNPNV